MLSNDFSAAAPWSTYDDDKGDVNMSHFSIARDEKQNGMSSYTIHEKKLLYCVLSVCCVIADCLLYTTDIVSLLDPLLLLLPPPLSPSFPLPPLAAGTLTFINRAQAAGFRPGKGEEGGPYIQAYMDYPPDWMLRGALPDDTDIDPKYVI